MTAALLADSVINLLDQAIGLHDETQGEPMPLPVLRVKTAHSEYLIDQNKQTFIRRPVHEGATDLSHAGVGPNDEVHYDEIMSELTEGHTLYIITGGGARYVRSTPIQSIEEVPA